MWAVILAYGLKRSQSGDSDPQLGITKAWKRLSAKVAGRVRQPSHRTTWKRLELAQVGTKPGSSRRQPNAKTSRCGCGQEACCSASPHLDNAAGSLRTVLCSGSLRLGDDFPTCCDDPAFPMTAHGVRPSTRPAQETGSIDFLLLNPNRHRASGSYKVRIETWWRTTCVATETKNKNPNEGKTKDELLTSVTFS